MSDEIIWEAPPSTEFQPPRPYIEPLKQVKARPGAWARIRTGPQNTIYSAIKRLKDTAGRTDEHWEFRSARVEDEEHVHALYARYRTAEQLEAATRRKRK